MRKIDEIKHPHSCLNRANDNEPLFVLRAHDPLASETVRYWAERYKVTKESAGNPDGFTERNAKKYQEAIIIAEAMEDWDDRPPKRAPNRVPVGEPALREAPSREVYEKLRDDPRATPAQDLEQRYVASKQDVIALVKLLKELLAMIEFEGKVEHDRNIRRTGLLQKVSNQLSEML